jgi:hypothetical protein
LVIFRLDMAIRPVVAQLPAEALRGTESLALRQVGYTIARHLFIVQFDQQAIPLLAAPLAHSIPSRFRNPSPHLNNLTPPHVSVRLLTTSESPRTPATGSAPGTDGFTELVAQMSWEDKAAFLEFYWKKR